MFTHARYLVGAAALALALSACTGGDGDSPDQEGTGDSAAVVDIDFAAQEVEPAEGVIGGTAEVVDGVLRIVPAPPEGTATQIWPLPFAGRFTITADWGPREGAAESGLWGLALGGDGESTGLMVACWSDGTPPRLVNLNDLATVAEAPNGSCGPGVSMTLTVDNTSQGGASSVTFSAAGSDEVFYEADNLISVTDAAYVVSARDEGFSVDMSRIVIEAE